MTSTFKLDTSTGDFVDDEATGQLTLVTDTDKLRQDVLQCITMPTVDDGTGAGLDQVIGVVDDTFSIRQKITSRLSSALQSLKQRQRTRQYSQRTRKELVSALSAVAVMPLNLGPLSTSKTTYLYRVTVTSVDAASPSASVSGSIVI